MANIAASDVTYTIKNLRTLGNSRKQNRIQLAFGNSTLTVAAGGIPLTIGKMGCPNVVESLVVVAQGTSGYKFQYIQSTACLVVMQLPALAHQHNVTITKGAAGSGLDLTLSADAATATINNNNIASTQTLTTNTPIVSKSPGSVALSEASTLAIAAQTIEVEVIGW